MFIAALSTIAKVWKEPKHPLMDELIKKMWYIYTMEGIMLSEMSQSEKDKYHRTSLICGI